MEKKHTRTPWTTNGETIYGSDGLRVCGLSLAGDKRPTSERNANAALIVKAVNGRTPLATKHSALLEAAKAYLDTRYTPTVSKEVLRRGDALGQAIAACKE